MQISVLMWLAHEQTGKAKWPAFLSAVQIGPTLVLGAGRRLADRIPKRGLIIGTQAVFLSCALALLGLDLLDGLTVWAMLAVMLAQGIVQAIDLPARLAFVPALVARTDLPNAVALNSLLFNSARAIGPALAALLLALGTAGPFWCFLLNAASYLAVIIALVGIRLPPQPDVVVPRNPLGGFHTLAKTPVLLMLALLGGLVAMGGWPLLGLLPSLTHDLGQEEGVFGTLFSAIGVGALCAALTAATIGNDLRPKVVLLGGLILVTAALVGLCATQAIAVATVCCALFGFGMILFFASSQSVVQLETKDTDRGKVMGIWAMTLSGGVLVGNFVLGPLADLLGVKSAIAIQACAVALATVILALRRVD